MKRRRRQRRGVLLLIVLSLLVLFLLVGLSFMVSAGQFNRLAKSAARSETTGMPGHKLADSVLYQLLRGTRNQHSSLQGHSLLEDLYGRDYMIGETPQVIVTPGDQVQEIRFTPAATKYGETYVGAEVVRPEAKDDYYAGCVLTFLNGNAKGHSARVLEYKTSGATPYIRIAGVSISNKKTGATVTPLPPNASTPIRFIINGRPFNGTGAGYNPISGTLNNTYSGVPLAFLPNYRAYAQAGITPAVAANVGGLDESYDCVDYQNMFLGKSAIPSLVTSALAEPVTPFIQYIRNTGGATPSFHRPYLLRHLFTQPSTTSLYAGLKHVVSMRPSQDHHPAFTGSNPEYNEHFGPWDVDNDGDGIPDSIWIDAGLAPVSAPDGRLYKPLVALHVVDMDGRVSINAAGSLEHVLGVGNTVINTTDVGVASINTPVPVGDMRAFGAGHGPADITINNGGLPTTLIQNRYRGYDRASDGSRLERLDGPAKANFLHWTAQSAPGTAWQGAPTDNPAPQFPSNDDTVLPFNFSTTISLLSGHGNVADYHARGVPFLDAGGNIAWMGPPRFGQYEGLDDPYEVNLLEPTTHDSPFDLSDLLTLNRVTTQSRLVKEGLYGPLMAFNSIEANSFTTHSFSIPAPPSINPGRFRGEHGLRRTIRDMFAARIQQGRGGVQPQDTATMAEIYEFAGQLMAPEFFRGEKLDINRALQANQIPGPTQSDADYRAQERSVLEEKARFARHLYNLMMMLSDVNTQLPQNLNSRERIRRIAQWAINVVDFGDADSVMTRFQYDPNPFDQTFDPNPFDDNVQGGEIVIWGMEHPELLLTESLAFHDRLLEDGDPGGLGDEDDDLDSIEEPEGSLFIELYCPRSKKRPDVSRQLVGRGPEDIYTPGNDQRLDLSKTVINDDDPIWRIGITEPIDSNNPQNKSLLDQLEDGDPLTQQLNLRRFVYFTQTLPVGADPRASFYNTSVPQLIMNPGTYLVLAPRNVTDVGSQSISLSQRYPATSVDPPAGEYNLSRFGQAVVMQSNNNNGLNVSEPLGGYDDSVLDPSGSDESLDALEGVIPYDVANEDETEFLENYRTIVLQRLANPNLPFDAIANPYLTLDWIPVDVTVFNSGTGTPANLEIVSRERTGRHEQLAVGSPEFADATFNIWSAWSDIERSSNGQVLTDSLGKLNDYMGPPGVGGPPMRPILRGQEGDAYAGAPAQFDPPGTQNRVNVVNGLNVTLSSLVWHNRPYANPYELLLVPATSSDRLTGEYTVSDSRTPYTQPFGAFGHLLNFFDSSSGKPGDSTTAFNAYRIFDFVSVPSRFLGTRKPLLSSVYPSVSEFREPGKVNLNTAIASTLDRVGCDSLLSDDASRPVNRDALVESLHGYERPQVSGTVVGYFPNGNQPAEVSNPIRAGVAADLLGQLAPTTTAAVNASLLRSKLPPTTPVAGENPQPALAPFEKPAPAAAAEIDNLALQNVRRNAYFRFRDLMKMGNSVTSQSNVFAVWITVGYFEIEPNYDSTNTIAYFKDAAHPDGYRYGIEMGSDVGQVVRDRAFYLIDRSIPVAFEPGVNHNVDKAVLVRRQLE